MAEISKLHRLRLLKERLSFVDSQWVAERDAEIEREGERDRQAAIVALTEVVNFCLDLGLEPGPLFILLSELNALETGATPGSMFHALPLSHRRRESQTRDIIKGRLAAVVAYKRVRGATRKEASRGVAQSIPDALHQRLKTVTHTRLLSWLDKWGGEGGDPGDGREGFRAMQAILDARQPGDGELQRILLTLASNLSAPDSR